jgi:4-amino-4-deoxy-L-arabinose transferase-like glycosyltransferase
MSLRTKLGGLFLAAVAVRIAFHLLTGFTADDAFITFRYAANLAAGHGFVYNLGEHVLGTSTPLFTWVLALLALLRVPVESAALFVALVCAGLTAALLYQFASILRFGRLAWIPALVYILWPRSVTADSSGMEAALFTLLVTAAFYYHHRRLNYYAVGLATLATLTRPEGGLVLLLLLASSCRRDIRDWKSLLATPALLLLPWLGFAWYYFGSPLPHSIPAKIALYSRFGTDPWTQNLIYILGLHNPAGWLILCAALVGGWWLYRKQYFGIVEAVWFGATVLFYTFSGTRLFFWYVAPLCPLLILAASSAAIWAIDRSRILKDNQRMVGAAIALLTVTISLPGLYRQVVHFQSQAAYANDVLKPAAFYLERQADPTFQTVAAEDIGHIGYYSGCRIFDRDGLVSPEAVTYNREGRYLDMILDVGPDWVGVTVGSPISGFLDDPRFTEKYGVVASFPDKATAQYDIFRRKQ